MDLRSDADPSWHNFQPNLYRPEYSSIFKTDNVHPEPLSARLYSRVGTGSFQDRKVAFAVQPLAPIFATTCPLSTNPFTIITYFLPPQSLISNTQGLQVPLTNWMLPVVRKFARSIARPVPR